MKKKRKSLEKTQRLITIGNDLRKADISRCCKAEIKQYRVYPFALYCDECNKDIVYGDQVIFRKGSDNRKYFYKCLKNS